jgi:hypothetical protein
MNTGSGSGRNRVTRWLGHAEGRQVFDDLPDGLFGFERSMTAAKKRSFQYFEMAVRDRLRV